MRCQACGGRASIREWDLCFVDGHGNEELRFGLPGFWCADCGKLVLDPDLLDFAGVTGMRMAGAIENVGSYLERIGAASLLPNVGGLRPD